MNTVEKYDQYSKRIKLFNGLNGDEVAQILRKGTTMKFRPGDTIFHKGQIGSNLFIVLSGKVNITIKGNRIALCKPGDAFGEMSVLNHRPHTASADAASHVEVFVLHEKQLNELLQQGVAVRLLLNVIHTLSAYLENANIINTRNERILRRMNLVQQEAAAV